MVIGVICTNLAIVWGAHILYPSFGSKQPEFQPGQVMLLSELGKYILINEIWTSLKKRVFNTL